MQNQSKRTRALEARRTVRAHQATLQTIRRMAAAHALDASAFRQAINLGVNIDDLVDWFARTHTANSYRRPEIQKRALDSTIKRLVATIDDPKLRARIGAAFDASHSRYLLASDIGFELGFASARALGDQ